jgi:dihydrofolate reductase
MAKLFFDLSVSLDGFVAGPEPSLDDPLGVGGEQLHDWAFATKAFQEMHGREGGETGTDHDVAQEAIDRAGATIMGRKMYSGGSGPWESDPNDRGWWGDEPPFHQPVLVLTHHEREPLPMEGGTTFAFVTDGIESALEQARDAAGDKDVWIGGADVAQQYLRAGLLDDFQIHVVPVFLGGGTRLLDNLGTEPKVELTPVAESPTGVTHLQYRVVK